MTGYLIVTVFCILLLFQRKDYYLRKDKKGKYTLKIPREERIAENVIKAEREMSIINHKKKPGTTNTKQYKSLNDKQLIKLSQLRENIQSIENSKKSNCSFNI